MSTRARVTAAEQVAVARNDDVRERRQRGQRPEDDGGVHDQGVQGQSGDFHAVTVASAESSYPSYEWTGCPVRSGIRCRPCPSSGPGSGSVDFTDDLRLAHLLADDADSLTEARFKALDLHVMSKPDLTPVTDADHAVEEAHPPHPVAGAVARRGHRRGARQHRPQPAPLGDRPHRRHQELRPWRARVGHAHRAGRRRRGGARCRVGPGAPAPLVGVEGPRRLHRPLAAQSDPLPPSPTYAASRTPRCPTPRSTGWDERDRLAGLPVTDAPLLADPRLRRLLVLHAARRGSRRHRRRTRAGALRHGRPRRHRPRGRRPVLLARRHRRPLRRQRAGLQRPPARGGAGVPRLAPRRRRRSRRPGPGRTGPARCTTSTRGGRAPTDDARTRWRRCRPAPG